MTARNRVSSTGAFLAAFLDWLHQNDLLDYSQVSIVGFSLGGKRSFSAFSVECQTFFEAHVAGLAGKQTTRGRVNTIVGLDPAGPLFSQNNPSERLASGDAEYVEGFT